MHRMFGVCGLAAMSLLSLALQGCNNTDPELIAALKAGHGASGKVDTSALDRRFDELASQLREFRNESAGGRADLSRSQAEGIASLERKLKTFEEDLDAARKAASSANSEIGALRSSNAGVAASVEQLRVSVEGVQSALKLIDPKELIAMSKLVAEKEGELIRAQSANDDLKSELEELNDALGQLRATLEARDAEIQDMLEGDVSKNPAYTKLRDELRALKKAHDTLKSDYSKMEALVRDYQNGRTPSEAVENATEGGGSNTNEAKDPPKFRSRVSAQPVFNASTGEFVVEGAPDIGGLPETRTSLWIIKADGTFICEIEVLKVWDEEKYFGGVTRGVREGNVPVKGDYIVLPGTKEPMVEKEDGSAETEKEASGK